LYKTTHQVKLSKASVTNRVVQQNADNFKVEKSARKRAQNLQVTHQNLQFLAQNSDNPT